MPALRRGAAISGAQNVAQSAVAPGEAHLLGIPQRDCLADYCLPESEARSAWPLYNSTVFRYDHNSDRSASGAKGTAILA
jgi:hypothetical protein